MVADRKYYDLLDSQPEASQADLKKSYRKKALRLHPDKGGDPDLFKEVTHAYEILSDEDKRQMYDQYGEEGLQGDAGMGMDPGDLFSQLFGGFGGGRRPTGPRKGKDLVHRLNVSLEDMYKGKTTKLALNKNSICNGCEGRGGKAGSVKQCTSCHGRGIKVSLRQLGPMMQQVQQQCDSCNGQGEEIPAKDRCKTCNGKKITSGRKTLEVHIDKGLKNGAQIVFNGEADQAPGTLPGDVVIVVEEKPHSIFKRKGNDLFADKEIDLLSALGGGSFTIPHLDERLIKVSWPAGEIITPESLRKIPKEGMPSQRFHELGDLFVNIKVKFPETISPELVPHLEKALPPRNVPESTSLHVDDVAFEQLSAGQQAEQHHRPDSMEEDDEDDMRGGAGPGLFRDNDIRGENILDVDQSALKEMGIPSVADRLDDKKSSSVEDSISRSMSLNMTMSKRKPAPIRPSQARPPPLVLDHAQQQHKNDIAYQPQKDKSTKSTLASLGVPGLKRPRGNSNPHRVPSNKELYTTAPLPNPPSSSRKNLLNLSSGSLRRPSTSNVVSRKQFSAHGIRPNTANPALHPYAKPQVSPTESVREEMFENGYRIGAGPYQSHNNSKLSLTDVRRKCVKFITAADGFTRTVDVSECEKADDVLARVLKKFGKINYLSKNQSGAIEDNDRTYFVYQGWGVFRCVDGQIYGYPLSDNEIIAVCQSPPDDPQRERGLYIQRTENWQLPKSKSKKKFEAFFTDKTPQKKSSKQSMHKQSSESLRMRRRTNRASMMSVMSGLGAVPEHDEPQLYESAAQLPSVNQADRVANPRGRLQNFHGQRPPSELISTHLADFFPTADIKSIHKTARNSRINRRDGNSVSSTKPIWESEPMPELPAPPSKYMDSKYKIPQKEPPKHDIPPVPGEPPMLPPVNVEPLDWSETRSMGSLQPTLGSRMSRSRNASMNDDTSSVLTMDQVVQEVENRVSQDEYRDGSIHEDGEDGDASEHVASPASSQISPHQQPLPMNTEHFELSPTSQYLRPAFSQRSPTSPTSLSPTSQYLKPTVSRRSLTSPASLSPRSPYSKDSQVSPAPSSRSLASGASEQTDAVSQSQSITRSQSQSQSYSDSRPASPLEPPSAIGDNFLRRPSVGLGAEGDENEQDQSLVTTDEDEDDSGGHGERKPIKWHKGALIGSGSFGSVFLGMNKSTGLLMAVKQVDLPAGNGNGSGDGEGSVYVEPRKKSMLDALEREIELLKVLKHSNIVQYLDSSLDESCLNIFLEYVPGGSVAALLQNYGAFEEELVRNFVKQILTGLNYLHTKGIIHRDIKGANILVDNKGGVKISDFGISKKKVTDNLFGVNKKVRQSLQGSVFWMAPEVVKQEPYTRKADIWSLGCLIVEMLTGEHPFPTLNQMQAIFKIGSSASPTIPDDISDDAKDFLRQTFETDHAARPSAAVLERSAFIMQITGESNGSGDGQGQSSKDALVYAEDVTSSYVEQVSEV
ncbi:hypothetical protein E3P94_01333 [Wallemia ichthyophaga]|nr:hypothetical protein E3P95_01201 [Wallemia ichthyophaga]TIB02772.1 hypothetical protein E3P94_01333 [Wallemia ichthyophaga]